MAKDGHFNIIKNNLHKLQVLQNRAARRITGADRYTRITRTTYISSRYYRAEQHAQSQVLTTRITRTAYTNSRSYRTKQHAQSQVLTHKPESHSYTRCLISTQYGLELMN